MKLTERLARYANSKGLIPEANNITNVISEFTDDVHYILSYEEVKTMLDRKPLIERNDTEITVTSFGCTLKEVYKAIADFKKREREQISGSNNCGVRLK